MAQFRAIIECDSPARVAESLQDAGCTLLGPWAAGSSQAAGELGLAEEHDVPVVLEAPDSAAATGRIRQIVGPEVRIQILKVLPADSEPVPSNAAGEDNR